MASIKTSTRRKKGTNPFEVRVNKKKHIVFGQRSKSIEELSRSTAIRKRKRTLLQEYRQRCKSNVFVDHRFSELDREKTHKKHLLKKILRVKKGKGEHIVSDDDQNLASLTHRGRLLEEMDEFDTISDVDSDLDEDGSRNDFGGILTRKRPNSTSGHEETKTRKHIYEEVISKSKAMKYERQAEKHEIEELFEQVDSDLKDILGILPKCPKPTVPNASGDYDKVVHEMMFEKRGRPTDRFQIQEEMTGGKNEQLKDERKPMMRKIEETSADSVPDANKDLVLSCPSLDAYSEGDWEFKDDEKLLGTSTTASIDALFGQYADLGRYPPLKALRYFDNIARLLFRYCGADPLHGRTVFVDMLCKYRYEWIIANQSPEYPPLSELLIFKLIAFVFPASDIEQSLVTPALLIMVQLLRKCEVKTRYHLMQGLFICDTLFEYVSKSILFVPELVNFLTSCCGSFYYDGIVFPPFISPTLQLKCADNNLDSLPSLLQLIYGCHDGVGLTHNIDYAILMHTLHLVARVLNLYCELSSFTEVFLPLTYNLQRISKECNLCEPELQNMLTMAIRLSSTPPKPRHLLHLKQKPKSIAFYTPKFDSVFQIQRRSKSIRGRADLHKKVQKEEKGAIREIRKDNTFLAKENLRESLQRCSERKKKTKEIINDLQTQ